MQDFELKMFLTLLYEKVKFRNKYNGLHLGENSYVNTHKRIAKWNNLLIFTHILFDLQPKVAVKTDWHTGTKVKPECYVKKFSCYTWY